MTVTVESLSPEQKAVLQKVLADARMESYQQGFKAGQDASWVKLKTSAIYAWGLVQSKLAWFAGLLIMAPELMDQYPMLKEYMTPELLRWIGIATMALRIFTSKSILEKGQSFLSRKSDDKQ